MIFPPLKLKPEYLLTLSSHLLTLSFAKSAIEKWKKDHSLNIFSAMLPEEIVKAAQESDARYAAGEPISVLDGVPVAVKDMIHIKGHLNYNGKSPLDVHSAGHEMPSEDDTMVRHTLLDGDGRW